MPATDAYRENFDRIFGSPPHMVTDRDRTCDVCGRFPAAVGATDEEARIRLDLIGPCDHGEMVEPPYAGSRFTLRNATRVAGAAALLAFALAALTVS